MWSVIDVIQGDRHACFIALRRASVVCDAHCYCVRRLFLVVQLAESSAIFKAVNIGQSHFELVSNHFKSSACSVG